MIPNQDYNLEGLNNLRELVCQADNATLETEDPFQCASVTYVFAALAFGWKIDADQPFQIAKDMEYKGMSVAVSWTFGVAASA